MGELNLAPGTSAEDAIYQAFGEALTKCWSGDAVLGAFDSQRATAMAKELIDYLAKLERDAHPRIYGLARDNLPPQAIGRVNRSVVAGQQVVVITRTGEVLDLGPEQPPPYAGEDLTAGQPVEWASWLSGRAVVGVTT
jgi:hypothetical protein